MTNHLLAGVLAVCFLVDPIVGVHLWTQFEKAAVRREVRRHILPAADRDGLVLLQFSEEETGTLLRWEHSREFEYDGQMYDIVESWTRDGRVYYRCWWDREETRLNHRLREIARQAMGDSPQVAESGSPAVGAPRSLSFVVARKASVPEPGPEAGRLSADTRSWTSIALPPPTPPPRPA